MPYVWRQLSQDSLEIAGTICLYSTYELGSSNIHGYRYSTAVTALVPEWLHVDVRKLYNTLQFKKTSTSTNKCFMSLPDVINGTRKIAQFTEEKKLITESMMFEDPKG